MPDTIQHVKAREVLDSRGHPTVEVELRTSGGAVGRAVVPSGASTGEREALELRDADKKRYGGKGVLSAVRNVNEVIAPKLAGKDVSQQRAIDQVLLDLDGTPNKSKLGANAILGVSLAAAHAAAAARGAALYESLGEGKGVTLPTPFMNVINGGAHADNTLDAQEFMIVPGGFPTFAEALRAGVQVFHALKAILKEKGLPTAVGDEGGFAPNLPGQEEEALALLVKAIEKSGARPGKEIALALDVAASELWKDGKYEFKKSKRPAREPGQVVDLYEKLAKAFPIVSIEDGMGENDWEGWAEVTKRMGARCQLVGDDVFVTQVAILKQGIAKGVANAILIKLNQVGTVTETLATVRTAQEAGYGVQISHRSGETEDTSIADLAVAVNAGMIKTGSASRTDRTAKYNRLLRIEDALGAKARFAGFGGVKGWKGA